MKFMNKCFKKSWFSNNYKETSCPSSFIPYFNLLQTKTKLKKSLKTILNCCEQRLIPKIKPDQVTTFNSKIVFPRILLMLSFVNVSVDSAKSLSCLAECARHLNVRIGVNNCTLPLITKPNNSTLSV